MTEPSGKNQAAVVVKPRVCCRLCLAPENECVSIYKTSAADKQPLAIKINACVQIKVHENDRLSPKICHACISYLNSWQSFKNRCDAAQRKQKSWIGMTSSEPMSSSSASSVSGSGGTSILKHSNQQNNTLKPALESAQQKFLQKQAELQKERLLQLVKQQQQQDLKMKQLMQQQLLRAKQNAELDVSFIKSEPMDDDGAALPLDDDDAENVQMDLDPSQFLARSDSDDENDSHENGTNNGPQILTSLGLTHINHVNSANPFNYLNQDVDFPNTDDDSSYLGKSSSTLNGSGGGGPSKQIPAKCSICNMQFSNRANARRHEKNIHGVHTAPMVSSNQFLAPSTSTPSSSQGNGINLSTVKTENTSSNNVNIVNNIVSKPRVKAKQEVQEEVDYNNPAKYRHLLTPAKLSFILRNLNFLEQAQDMTCKCCNKQFPSYKFFMGHMRKKYHSLPRNVCFKCLKQFQSKGQFIGHLKRRNCTNLYRLVMNDDTISKDIPCSNNRIPNKDILANKVYGCKICSETFRLKVDFRDHVYKMHHEVQRNRETPNASCINCNEAFFDSNVRRRHFNNLDCLVYIICVTCQDQFVTNAQYIEHVYKTHLNQHDEVFKLEEDSEFERQSQVPPSGFRSPQVCPVCNKQYNNYYNVLRHMESKHPDQLPQIYQCPECQEGFPRQTELREHLMRVHNQMIPRSFKPLKLPAYICKDCGGQYETKDEWIEHQSKDHQTFACMFCDFKNENREEFEQHLEQVHQNYKGDDSFNTSEEGLLEYDQTEDEFNAKEDDGEISDEDESALLNPADNSGNNLNGTPQVPYQAKRITCRLCNKRISTKTGLKKHMILEHGMTGNLVGCTLCKAEFANDKGLKVHLFRSHQIREADYASVLPPDLLDPATQQLRKLQQNQEELKMIEDNENGINDFECDICHIVCRSKEQLKEHGREVHLMEDNGDSSEDENEEPALPEIEDENSTSRVNSPATVEELWYQCRYCNRSFNSSKKLTIHMHSHEAVDHTDFSCKDCGIKYASKKSLWVHRHKKHPRIAEPSPCDICKKVLFDKTELFYHMQTHSDDPYFNDSLFANSLSATENNDSNLPLHFLETSATDSKPMDDAFKQQQLQRQKQILQQQQQQQQQQQSQSSQSQSSRKRPPSQNPVMNADGVQEYGCDMCEKKFLVANALQVHRGWHFRSPDGRKVRDPQQMWRPDQVPPSKVRRTASNPVPSGGSRSATSTPPIQTTPPPPPLCPYCDNKFASHNNLRRHIIEVHKRHESRENENVNLDRVGECSRCKKTFSTLAEWVDHKIADARGKRMNSNYEWKCDICAKVFTRKERLLQHMLSHLNDREMDQDVLAAHNAKLASGEIMENEESSTASPEKEDGAEEEKNGTHSDEDSEDEALSDEEEAFDDDENKRYSCQLCQVDFDSATTLRQHVAEHFLNGGIDTPKQAVKQEEALDLGSTVIVNNGAEELDNGAEELDDEEEEDDEIENEEDDVIEELEEDYAELDADYDHEGELHIDEQVPASEQIVDESNVESEEDVDENTNSSNSQTSSSAQSNGKLRQDFAAISQEHKCRVCSKTYPDQLSAFSCMNSHLNSN